MTSSQPGPNLTGRIAEAHALGEDLRRATAEALRGAIEIAVGPEHRDAYLARWNAEHAGNSLVVVLTDDGTVGSCVEMPSAEAAALANGDPEHVLIIATWSTR